MADGQEYAYDYDYARPALARKSLMLYVSGINNLKQHHQKYTFSFSL